MEQPRQGPSSHHLHPGAGSVLQPSVHRSSQGKADIPGVLAQIYRSTGGMSSNQRQQDQLTPEITRWLKNLNNRNQGYLALSEPSSPTTASFGYPNTPENQDFYLKSHLMMMIVDFKNNISNSLKEIQENTSKQVEALKEETQKP